MKNYYFLILSVFFLFPNFTFSQDYTAQVDYYFQHLDKSQIPTDILYERVFPAVDLKKLTDTEIDTTSVMHFLTAFAELQTADYRNRWQPASTVITNLSSTPREIPIGVINIDFNSIDERAIADNLLDITTYQGDSLLVDVPNRSRSPYLLHTVTFASPLKLRSHSLNPHFYWEVTRQDSQNNISQLEVNFNLGGGWHDLSSRRSPFFPEPGVYYIDFKVTLSNGEVRINRAKIEILREDCAGTIQQETQAFTPTDFLDYFRDNINDFVDGTEFEPYCEISAICQQETNLWNSNNPLGAIVKLDISLYGAPGGNILANDGVIVCAEKANSYWRFMTIEAPYDDNHPVSGTREFGIEQMPNGSYNIYVRGVDRFTSRIQEAAIDLFTDPFLFADDLWESLQENMNTFINATGGTAAIIPPDPERVNWDKVKDVLNGDRPIMDLGCE